MALGGRAWLPQGLFVLSGAVALALEVLWMRRFTELLGATAAAAAATLAGVFLGFAIGSFAGGRLASRVKRPLRAYGLLELGASASALLVLPMLRGAESAIPPLRSALAGAPVAARGIESLLAAAIVVLPTACMGATLPLLAPVLGPGGGRALYAANTFGGVAGCLAVPFALLPRFGIDGSYQFVAGLGALVGACAWLADRRSRPAPPALVAAAAPEETSAGADDRGATGLAVLSGALLLGLESAFTRLFGQIHESSLHAFATVVAAFLFALAAGAVLARILLRAGLARRSSLALVWLGAGLLTAATPRLFDQLTDGLTMLRGDATRRGVELLRLAALVLVPPVALGGAALPLLLGPARRAPDGAQLGRILGWNTLGALAGPLLATLVAFPAVGLHGTFALAGVLLAAGAVVAAPRRARRLRSPLAVGALATGVAILFLAVRPPPRVHLDAGLEERLVEVAEGPLAIAAVIEDPRGSRIKVDNHYVLGGTGATGDLRQLGHLPLLLHPSPERVAFLGLGTGITAGAAVLHPVEAIDAVELLPEVADLARRRFRAANLGLLEDARVRLVCDDARTFVRGRAGGFDVIVGDLVVPWRAGESALYTAEHFAQTRAALAPRGLFCQWLPAYQLTVEQFDAIAATFLDTFPRASLWRGDFMASIPAIGLVGHLDDVDPAAVAGRVRELAPRLDAASPYLVHPAGLWLFCVGALPPSAPRWRAARRHTRDSPWLELAGPQDDAPGRSPPLAGEPLDALFDEVAAAPLDGGPLASLRPKELDWRAAGAQLWRASTLAIRGRSAAARELALSTLSRLPPELSDALRRASGR